MFIAQTSSARTRTVLAVLALIVVFFALRLPGLDLPYHQDEWKNVSASATVEGAGKFFAHPPGMQILFVVAHGILGTGGMRLLPLIFSVGTAVLLYMVVKGRAGEAAALWAVGLFAICVYNIHGSLSPDVDGAVLPFLFLLAVYAYDRWKSGNGSGHSDEVAENPPLPESSRNGYLVLLAGALLVGFLIKLSFIIVIGVLILDYIWQNRRLFTVKISLQGVGVIVGFGLVYAAFLYLIQAIYPAFSIELMLSHASQSAGDLGRNWTQIIVQGAKALYLLSPLLVVPLLFTTNEVFKRSRLFLIYLVLGLIFYFVLFDFSRAALDKYLLFLIVPLAAVVGMVLADYLSGTHAKSYRTPLLIGILLSAVLIALNFLPHSVVALYPKTEWFSKVLHGEWNILNPFIGGNGPMGFYVSFLFVAVSYIVSAILGLAGFFKRQWRANILVVLIVIGISYNLVFAEEFLYGKINGNAPLVLRDAISYVGLKVEIKQVLTYNDTGAGPLALMGKYAGRIYAIPESEEGYRKKFAEFDGHYMVIDIPHLYESGFYGRFFAKCEMMFQSVSGRIVGRVYDCAEAKKAINSL